MTEEATVVQAANPYNTKQTPVDIPRGVISADDGLAQPTKKEEVVVVEAPENEVPDEPIEDATQQFKKVDYKKRYFYIWHHVVIRIILQRQKKIAKQK